jgi:hypothetical protein
MYDEDLILQLLGGKPTNAEVSDAPCEARPVAMVYAPVQEWRDLYDNEAGHARGTIFKELDFPFLGGVPRD